MDLGTNETWEFPATGGRAPTQTPDTSRVLEGWFLVGNKEVCYRV